MKIIYMGTPSFSILTLELLLSAGNEVAAVYTQPDREAGRGRSLAASPVKKKALEYGLTIEQPDNFKEPRVIEKLAEYRPDCIVVFSYGQILPRAVLDIPSLGCVNVHPSLLPKYRGAAPVISAILGGDEFTGVTIIKMATKLDAGDILMQAQIPVADYDTADLLTEKLSLIASQMVVEVLPRLERGEIVPRPQNDSLVTFSRQLTKQDGEIDWQLPANDIGRRIRAFDPWPGCYTTWRGKQLKIISAGVFPAKEGIKAGEITTLEDKNVLGIGTGNGILGVTELQPEGKRRMPAKDFMLGQKGLIGEILPSQAED